MRAIAMVAVLAGSHVALADQCAVLTQDQAETARKTVVASPGSVVALFCAPCGDKLPTRLTKRTIAVNKMGADDFRLFINGSEVDLAYTYYAVGDAEFRNLAMAASCAVQQVPELVTMVIGSPETEVNQLVDAQVKDPLKTGAIYAADAFAISNAMKPTQVSDDVLKNIADEPHQFQNASAKASERAVTFSRDRTAAWIDLTLKVALSGDHYARTDIWRVTEIAVNGDAGWRIVAAAWTAGVTDSSADKDAIANKLAALDPLESKGDDALRATFTTLVNTGFAEPGRVANTVVAIGTAPGERSSGPTFAKGWNAAWVKHLDVTGVIASVSPTGTTGWVVANTQLHKRSGKTAFTVPVRLFFVFDKDSAGAWQLVRAHFAVP